MSHALVIRSRQDERTVTTGKLMPPDEARRWLDQAFVDLDCEPVRASGKVLTRDKVMAVAQAVGLKGLDDDAAWAQAFASAALGALGQDRAVIDLDAGGIA